MKKQADNRSKIGFKLCPGTVNNNNLYETLMCQNTSWNCTLYSEELVDDILLQNVSLNSHDGEAIQSLLCRCSLGSLSARVDLKNVHLLRRLVISEQGCPRIGLARLVEPIRLVKWKIRVPPILRQSTNRFGSSG